jgi:nitroimidazol reductase NimA-like FMN-containing flavoprotein (pyridoxamine 5'-phosphate oxidase superfamily)
METHGKDIGSTTRGDASPETGHATTHELSVARCWALLREGVVGRVAVVHHRRPDIFPVNYAVDHGTVVFRTGTGTLFTAADGAFVAFEVDGYDVERAQAWSVVIRGVSHEVYQLDDALAAMRLPLYPWHDAPKPRIMRIRPDSVTGRLFEVRGGHGSPDDTGH